MKPYFETELGKLYQGDCLEVMKEIPDKSVDLVLADPPYEIDLQPRNKKWNGSQNSFDKIKNDKEGFCLKWFNEIERVGKNYIIFGANNFIEFIPRKYGWIVWDKRLSEKGDKAFGSPFELAITNLIKKYKMYRVQHGGVINADSIKGNNEPRFHPTQKPIILFEKILKDFSGENDLILDPFLGSGTTAVACEKLDRHWIGVEISEKYCEIAKARIEAEVRQGRLL